MTDERKIITREQYEANEYELKYLGLEWDNLPDAPKHTDEEYDEAVESWHNHSKTNQRLLARIKELENRLQIILDAQTDDSETTNGMLQRQVLRQYKIIEECQARIKELENTLENHGPEGHNVTNLQFANAVAQWEQEQIEVVSENRQLKVRIKELEDDK